MIKAKAQNAPLVGSLSDLEYRLGVSRSDLSQLLQSRAHLYESYETSKKQHPYPGEKRRLKALEPSKPRRIDNPVKQLKDIQRKILRRILDDVELPEYMFGAVSGKTLTAHTDKHVPNQSSTLVRLDISSYYPNVTCDHVYFVWSVVLNCPPTVAQFLTELTTFQWHLPQGAPTSPAIANVFLASIYAPICMQGQLANLTISTWVDDLIFSGSAARSIMETVRQILADNGFKISKAKREIFGSKEAKNVTGARVGRYKPRAMHKQMSDLRAAIHRLAIKSVPAEEYQKYRQNLVSRIAHIGQLNKDDATKLRTYAKKKRVHLK